MPRYETCELHIQLLGIDPPVIREVDVNASITLRQLHHIIQIAFGWESKHLHQFMCGRDLYTDASRIIESPRWNYQDDRKVPLSQIAHAGLEFNYLYDFGDDWMHTVTVKSIVPTDTPLQAAVLRKAEFGAPPEDCGGVVGYVRLLDGLASPANSSEYFEAHYWLEPIGPLNPKYCDERAINAAFVRLAQNGGGRT